MGVFPQEGFLPGSVVALELQIRAEVSQIEGAVTMSGLIEVDDANAVAYQKVPRVEVLVNRHPRCRCRGWAGRSPKGSQPLSRLEHFRAVSAYLCSPRVRARDLPLRVEVPWQLHERHVQLGQPPRGIKYAIKGTPVVTGFAQGNPGARSIQHHVLLPNEGQQLRYAEPSESERSTRKCLQMRTQQLCAVGVGEGLGDQLRGTRCIEPFHDVLDHPPTTDCRGQFVA